MHPKYIQEKLDSLNKEQFGYNAFGLKATTRRTFKNYIKGKKEIYIDGRVNNMSLDIQIFK